MRLSELQKKDIIKVDSGLKLGRIIDIEFNPDTGEMQKLVIENNKGIKSMFSNDIDYEINYKNIKKIGKDVVLIE